MNLFEKNNGPSLLNRLKTIFQNKWNAITEPEYFENLGCEVKISDVPFLGNENFVPISFQGKVKFGYLLTENNIRINRYNLKTICINIPIELAEKIITLGNLP